MVSGTSRGRIGFARSAPLEDDAAAVTVVRGSERALVEQLRAGRTELAGKQTDVLRLATGGWPTRPVAVDWRAGSASEEIYRGVPDEDRAEAQTKLMVEHFDQKVNELLAQG